MPLSLRLLETGGRFFTGAALRYLSGALRVDMIPVSSSNIDAVGYEPMPVARLYVRFKNGRTYLYENVPPDVYDGLSHAPSVGEYFNEHIKHHYGAVEQ